jgi:Domain of unknown function (DUF4349)
MRDRRQLALGALVLVSLSGVAGGVAGCAGSSSSGSQPGSAEQTVVAHGSSSGGLALGISAGNAPAVAGGDAGRLAAPGLEPARLPSEVIKTAMVELRVAHGRVAADTDHISLLAVDMGGYVSHSDLSRSGQRSGTIVVRIPVQRFHDALDSIAGLGSVQSESQTGVDVSQQFVDLGARLQNLRAQETFLRRLMTRARTVAGSITIEDHLTEVELGIEQITGQLRYLRNRTSFSTITVQLAEAGAKPPVHHHASTLWKAGARSLRSALSVAVAVIVGAGYVVPLAILGLLALGAARLLRQRLPRPAAHGGDGPADV